MVLCLTFASFALASSIFDNNLLLLYLTTLSWMLNNFDFFSHSLADDTCSALKDFQRNPQNNILQIILQSEKTKTSDKTLEHIGHTVPNFITQVLLSIISKKHGQELTYILLALLRQLYFFRVFDYQLNSKLTEIQGLGLNDMRENSVGKICDPFSSAPNYNFTPDLCPKDIIPIEELKYLSYKLQFTQHE